MNEFKESIMGNKDSLDIDKLIESIKNNLKTELESMKSDIKSDLKNQLEDIKSNLRDELNTIKSDLKSDIDDIRSEGLFSNEPSRPPEPPFSHDSFFAGGIFETSGNETTKVYNINDFTGVDIGGTFDAEIKQADSFSISITAIELMFHNFDISKEGNNLKVNHSRHIGWKIRLSRPKVTITMPLLKELRLSGAANAAISGFKSSEVFRLSMSGASSITGDIAAGNADIEVSGASRARLTGSSKDTIIKASGANRLDLRDFSIENAAIRLSGSCNCIADVTGRLDARLSGASNFSWVGNPVMGDIRTSGASRLTKE
jgi:hypothetical protein